MAERNLFGLNPLDRAIAEFESKPVNVGLGLPQLVRPGQSQDDAEPVRIPAAQQIDAGQAPQQALKGLAPPPNYMPVFENAARKYNVPVNVLMALGHQESRYNPNARGPMTKWGNAHGMMQYLDSTAKNLGINPYDPNQAVEAAAMQLRERLDKGYSMEDAVKEHFAGPNRKLWGAKTKQYGIEVLGKARAIADQLYADQGGIEAFNDQITRTDNPNITQGNMSIMADGPMSIPAGTDTKDVADIAKLPSLDETKIVETGFWERLPQVAKNGWDNMGRSLDVSRAVLSNDFSPQTIDLVASNILEQAKAAQADQARQNPSEREVKEAIERFGKTDGFVDSTTEFFSLLGTAFSNPKGVAIGSVEQLANMLPSIGGAAGGAVAGAGVGAAVGSVVPGPGTAGGAAVGALWGSRAGLATGTAALEYGNEITEAITSRLEKENKPLTRENIASLLSTPEVQDEIKQQAATKGLTLAAVDTLTMGLAGKVGAKGFAQTSKAKKAGYGAGAVGIELAGEPLGEGVSQLAARGEIDKGDVAAEFIYGAGTSAGSAAIGTATQAAKDRIIGTGAEQPPAAEQPAPAPDPVALDQTRTASAPGIDLEWQEPQGRTDNRGPLTKAVERGMQAATDAAIAPEAQAIERGMPPVGTPVILAPEGIEPIPAIIEGYLGQDVSVRDRAGNVLQLPIDEAAQIMRLPEQVDLETGEIIEQPQAQGGAYGTELPGQTADSVAGADDVRAPSVEAVAQDGANQPQGGQAVAPDATVGQPENTEAALGGAGQGVVDAVEPGQQAPALKVEDMTPEQLQERRDYLIAQARNNGGWNKKLIQERNRIDAALNQLSPPASEQAKPAEQVTPRNTVVKTEGGVPLVELYYPREGAYVLVRRDHWEEGRERLAAFNSEGKRNPGVLNSVPRDLLRTPQREADVAERADAVIDSQAFVEPDVIPESAYVEGEAAQQTQPAPAPEQPAPTEDERLAGKRNLYKAIKDSGAPDDVAANSVVNAQFKANESGTPMSVWRHRESGTIGIVPEGQKSPLNNAELVATIYPDAPTANEAPAAEQPAPSEQQSTVERAKPKKASKEDLERLFGIDQKRAKALERIAKGRAWFGDQQKARDFITKNGLKDTHEAVQTGAKRWEAKARGDQDKPSESVSRDKNNRYAKVKLYGKSHIVTPYDDHFVIRQAGGLLARDDQKQPFRFATEDDAIAFAKANEKAPASNPAIDELRNQVTGAIERGEKEPITEQKAQDTLPSAQSGDADGVGRRWTSASNEQAAEIARRARVPERLRNSDFRAMPSEVQQRIKEAIERIDAEQGAPAAPKGIKVGDRVTVEGRGEATVTEIQLDAPKVYEGTAIKVAFDNTKPDGSGTGWFGVNSVSPVAQGGEKKAPAEPSPKAKPDSMGGFTNADEAVMSLRRIAHKDERPGDILLNTLNPSYVTVEQAVAAARQYMEPEAWTMPFQFNRVLDIAPRDWQRMVEAMRGKQAAPAASLDADRFAGNKIFTADKVEAARARLRAKLGQINSGIDPETLIDGMTIAGAYIESGVRNFSDYAQRMVADLGDGVKPYLLSFWEGARNYPGLDTKDMTGVDESKRQFDAFITPADAKTEAVGDIVTKPAKRTKKTGQARDRVLTQDWGVDHIDAYSEEGEQVKANFLKEARSYLNAVAEILTENGFTPHMDKKGRPEKPVSVNESGIAGSGDISLTLAGPNGTGAYVHIGDSALRGVVPTTQSGIAIMFRASENSDKYGAKGSNQWAPVDLSAADFAALIEAHVKRVDGSAASQAQARIEQGEQNARDAIYEDGARPLEEVEADDVQGIEGQGDAERGGAEGQQGSGQAGSATDAVRVPTARGRGSRASRNNTASPGRKRVSPAKEQVEQQLPDLFETAPEAEIAQASAPNVPAANFVIDDSLELGRGTEGQKYQDNVAAIKTLKQIEQEGRRATPDEQRILARYVGWGGLKNAFRVAGAKEGQGVAKGWDARVSELEELLTPAELRAARNSTTAAHYTSQTVVEAIWKGVERLGFNGGSVLEPSVGTGNFIGLMPESVRGSSNVLAVEYDSLTARIAQQLYPQSTILHSGFEGVPTPRNYFALAIGNPPFGRESLTFKGNPSVNGKSIHNQFFLASLDAVTEDGLMGMVVSHNLMDALGNSARLDMAAKAHFLGAIRLPDTAFKENARTEVVTDILFFRKRNAKDADLAQRAVSMIKGIKDSGDRLNPDDLNMLGSIRSNIESWVNSQTIQMPDKTGADASVNVNEYFLANPRMVLGRMDASGTMNARADLNVRLDDPSTFESLLNAAIERLPRSEPKDGVAERSLMHYETVADALRLAVNRAEPGSIIKDADGKLKMVVDMDGGDLGKSVMREIELTADTPFNEEYNLTLDGKWQRTVDLLGEDGKPLKVMKNGKATNRNEKQVLTFDNLADIPAKDKWGADRVAIVTDMLPIRNLMKRQLMLESTDANERMIEENRARLNKAYDGFVEKHGQLHSQKVAKIALMMPDGALALAAETVTGKGASAKYGKADIMSRRVTMPPKPAEKAATPADAVAISLSEYGGINVERIATLLGTDEAGAIEAISKPDAALAYFDPEAQDWVSADQYLSGPVRRKLLAAKSAGLESNIAALEKVIPEDWDSSQITPNIGSAWIPGDVYADFIKHLGYKRANVSYSAVTNAFDVRFEGEPTAQWQTSGRAHNPAEIVSRLLNSRSMKVTYTDNEGKTHVDEEATAETQIKANEISNEFLDWAYVDDDRRNELVRIFNEKYNTRVVRQYEGSHLQLPGKVPDRIIKMRRHQKNAIWRGIIEDAVLYDHVVGAGKAGSLDSKLLTPTGWVRMGDIKVGDYVITQSGKPTLVEAIYPQGEKEIFKVTFSDGASTECCDEHLWLTWTYRERSYSQRAQKLGKQWDAALPKVRPLSEIRETLVAPHLGAKNHSIPMVEAVEFEAQAIPLDPYMLGALIGDGNFTHRSIKFTKADKEIVYSFALPEGSYLREDDYESKCIGWGITGKDGRNPVLDALRDLGLHGHSSHTKFVPDVYKFNTPEVRLAVLRGLMDTDGWIDKKGVSVCFSTASERLADDVTFLVQSFGGTTAKTVKTPRYTYKGERLEGAPAYVLTIKMPPHINPFHVSGKASKVVAKTKYAPVRYIVSVESIGKKPAQCIQVADPSHLYVTDDFIVTHNTYTAIARIMERRRMGMSRKPMVVVPNHLIEQWASDVTKLYPGAKVLAAGKADFERKNRRKLFARIASGDYDMVIIGHSSFGFIEIDPATEQRYIEEELRAAYDAIEAAQQAAEEAGFTGFRKPLGVAEAERLVKKLESRLDKLRSGNRDRLLTFEEMGVDDLTVDEAHEFKNLAYNSNLTGVSGMGNKTGSQKAMDLHIKVRSLRERQGTSVAFLTGTPISNSVAEMFLVLKNLVPNELKELGIDNFDAWRSMFVSYAAAYEPTEAGGVKEVTRLGREWMNMKSLMDLYYSVSDAVTLDDIKTAFAEDNPGKEFPVPKVKSQKEGKGDRAMVAVKPSAEQREILREIVSGFESLRGISDLKERNAMRLRLMDRARKVSLDPRAVDPTITVSSKDGKIPAVVNNVARIYKKWDADKGTQVIFLDRSVPKAKGDDKKLAEYDALRDKLRIAMEQEDEAGEAAAVDALAKYNANEMEEIRNALAGGWNAYEEIKRQLVEQGIPENEVRFVQEANTDEQKKALFNLVKSGAVRVLIGSTPRMGAGTNVQDRLVALHHVDVTWKPSDIEQREGRIVRQGNQLLEKYGDDFEVEVIAYATEMTVDAKMWALNATKLKAINGIRKYDGSFMMEFEDEESANMAEMAALATGNPLMVERVTLTGDIQKLELQQRSYKNRVNALRDSLNKARRMAERGPKEAELFNAFADAIEQQAKGIAERTEQRSLTVGGKTFNNADDASLAAAGAIEKARKGDEKARFSVEVGGNNLTSQSAIADAISEAFGDPGFEATIDGKTFIGLSDASKTLTEKVGRAIVSSGGRDIMIDGVTINGMKVEIDVSEQRFSKGADKDITFILVDNTGESMGHYRSVLSGGVPTQGGMRAGLQKLFGKLNPQEYRNGAKRLVSDAKEAEKKIPGLEEQVAKPWDKAQELEDKRNRLKDVISQLESASDAARLADNAEGDAAENVERFSVATDTGTSEGRASQERNAMMRHADVMNALREGPLGSVIDKLIGDGHIIIHPTKKSLPRSIKAKGGAIQGYTDTDGRIHLAAESLTRQTAMPVALHEGFHGHGEKLVGTRQWNAMMRRMADYQKAARKRKAEGRVKEGDFYDQALRRVDAAIAQGAIAKGREAEEFAAYAIESYELAPAGIKKWVDDFIGMVKDWLARRFNIQAGEITPAQLRAFAVAALRNADGTAPQVNDSLGGSALGSGAMSVAAKNKQTSTAAFRAWFGDSKVVDAEGKPLVVYHGTNERFTEFLNEKRGTNTGWNNANMGFFFIGDRKLAEDFARDTSGGDVVIDAYLSIQKPLDLTRQGIFNNAEQAPTLVEIFSGERLNEQDALAWLDEEIDLGAYADIGDALYTPEARAIMERDGYDGIISDFGAGNREYVAFRPEQIKSATGNVGTFDPNSSDIRFSVADEQGQTSVTRSSIIERLSDSLDNMKPALLATIPLNYFEELARPSMRDALKAYMKNKRAMDAYRGEIHGKADNTAQKWLKLRAFSRSDARNLAALMHDSTIAQVDPSKSNADPALKKRYDSLSDEAKALYAEVRDAYLNQSKELDRILLENIGKAMDLAVAQAERRYRDRLQKIQDSGLKGEEREAAELAAEKTYRTATTKAVWSRNARMTALRRSFESNRLEGPYFPLARFGQYFVTVRDVDGSVISFSRRETVGDMRRLANQMRAAYPGATVETGLLSNKSEVEGAMDPRFVAEVEEILSGAEVSDEIRDQIWQRYLESMPDMSTRKRFIHRKGVEGFEQDALRSFSHHMFHAAHQMARLKYGPEMLEQVNQVEDAARRADDPVRGMQLSNELRRRHQWVMNPIGSKVAQTMTSLGFIWYLGITPAAAIVNLSQTVLLGVPVIGSRFGFTKANVELMRAFKDFAMGKGSTMRANLTDDERAAMQAAYNSGLIDKSQAHDLAGVGDTGVEYSALRQRVMGAISWFFHQAEKLNREVTALAAYRAARSAGRTHEQAIDDAHELTWKTHFDYSNSNRPRVMQNDFAKVALVFRNFQINMLYRLFRDIHQTFKGESAQARKEALSQLVGIVGLMALNAGVKGVPFFSMAMILMGLVFGGDDEPFSFEERMKAAVLDLLGPELGGVLLNGVPGHYLGIDLTSRIGMPDLWFRSSNRELDSDDEYQYWLSQILGAVPGIAESVWRGLNIAIDGNVARGIETASPKAVKDILKSWRYSQEGVTTLKGEPYLAPDDMSSWNIIAQAIGFTPAAVSETYERNNALKNAEKRILDKRRKILNEFALTKKLGDDEGNRKVIERLKEFNKQFPRVAITGDSLRQSLRARQSASNRTKDGLMLDRRLDSQLRREVPGYIYREERR